MSAVAEFFFVWFIGAAAVMLTIMAIALLWMMARALVDTVRKP